jgi:hypothetical protein
VRPRVRSALLWGAVGFFSFLVLLQGYRLFVAPLSFGITASVGVALGVGVAVTAVTYVTEARLAAKGRT